MKPNKGYGLLPILPRCRVTFFPPLICRKQNDLIDLVRVLRSGGLPWRKKDPQACFESTKGDKRNILATRTTGHRGPKLGSVKVPRPGGIFTRAIYDNEQISPRMLFGLKRGTRIIYTVQYFLENIFRISVKYSIQPR